MEIHPLKTLEEVEEWSPPAIKSYSITPLALRTKKTSSRILLCHDMKGGYLDDRLIQGTQGSCNQYRFFHWSFIDGFIYFSHYFITIPPIGWINAAHKNGVPVLGTIITEWNEGEKLCEKLLASKNKVYAFVDKLVEVTKFFGFEGWLINIENEIKKPELLVNLHLLVKYLSQKIKSTIPSNQGFVIWYDSVTVEGELDWQNQLNKKNRIYFDACNGIFLNYAWKPNELHVNTSEAGMRSKDVFVGIDVWGRNCYKGGGFNTSQAFEVIQNNGLSIAIFAPGWTHEVLGDELFNENEYKFWEPIGALCDKHGPCDLPLSTNFCQGFGLKMFNKGKIIGEKPWYNLNLQELQPSYHGGAIKVFFQEAYNGGSCLRITGPCNTKIFECDLFLKPSLFHLLLYTFKNINENNKAFIFFLSLELKSSDGKYITYPLKDYPDSISEEPSGWITKKFVLNPLIFGDLSIKSINIIIEDPASAPTKESPLYLFGQLKVHQLKNPKFGLTAKVKTPSIIDGKSRDFSLHWNPPSFQATWDIYYMVIDRPTWTENFNESMQHYIGTTCLSFFEVNKFQIKENWVELKELWFFLHLRQDEELPPYTSHIEYARVLLNSNGKLT